MFPKRLNDGAESTARVPEPRHSRDHSTVVGRTVQCGWDGVPRQLHPDLRLCFQVQQETSRFLSEPNNPEGAWSATVLGTLRSCRSPTGQRQQARKLRFKSFCETLDSELHLFLGRLPSLQHLHWDSSPPFPSDLLSHPQMMKSSTLGCKWHSALSCVLSRVKVPS